MVLGLTRKCIIPEPHDLRLVSTIDPKLSESTFLFTLGDLWGGPRVKRATPRIPLGDHPPHNNVPNGGGLIYQTWFDTLNGPAPLRMGSDPIVGTLTGPPRSVATIPPRTPPQTPSQAGWIGGGRVYTLVSTV